jgi:hypothetical protein
LIALKAKRGKALGGFTQISQIQGKAIRQRRIAHGDAGRLFWHSALLIQLMNS